MPTLSRSMTICFLIFAVLGFTATSRAQTKPPIAEQIAKAYGLDSFGQIDAIRYTFSLPALKVLRTWTWEPKADRVTYEGKDKEGKPVKVTYVRSQLDSQPENVKKEIDPGFINDQYWLLFPFHMVWDTGAAVEDKGMEAVPTGKGKARHIVVKYGSEGYTPGDTWEFYVGPDNRILYQVFHHGGNAKPSLVKMTWEGYKQAGPLLISTLHKGTADGHPAEITFSNVAVKTAGSDNWVEAK
ncbi:MAG TPA: hypothetical protein VKH81_02635 [Candidatus Angelobacter sp.]|nr:hypothetical protein [Candidatus Angelobacter sp.]